MRKLLLIAVCFFYGCPYDPPRGSIIISNNSERAIYIYETCCDTLPAYPPLNLFDVEKRGSSNITDIFGDNLYPLAYSSPSYRINPYERSGIQMVGGTRNNPTFPCNNEYVNVFFIPEDTMRMFSWDEISARQLYAKKVVLRKEELRLVNWKYIYTP